LSLIFFCITPQHILCHRIYYVQRVLYRSVYCRDIHCPAYTIRFGVPPGPQGAPGRAPHRIYYRPRILSRRTRCSGVNYSARGGEPPDTLCSRMLCSASHPAPARLSRRGAPVTPRPHILSPSRAPPPAHTTPSHILCSPRELPGWGPGSGAGSPRACGPLQTFHESF